MMKKIIEFFINNNFNLVTKEDVDVMNIQDDTTLAEWCNLLNCWEWPEKIMNEEKGHNKRRSQLMRWIEERLGHRFILRVHNKDMSNSEFNDFYDGSFKGDKDAFDRHIDNMKYRYINDNIYTNLPKT